MHRAPPNVTPPSRGSREKAFLAFSRRGGRRSNALLAPILLQLADQVGGGADAPACLFGKALQAQLFQP